MVGPFTATPGAALLTDLKSPSKYSISSSGLKPPFICSSVTPSLAEASATALATSSGRRVYASGCPNGL